MNQSIATIRPFIASLSYLACEARRLELHPVAEICHAAMDELARYVVDISLDNPKEEVSFSSEEYDFVTHLLSQVSRMPDHQLKTFIDLLNNEHEKFEKTGV